MMKKLVSLLLALVMALGLCVNVWAEGEDNGPPAGGEMTGTTGTVKNVDSLACVDGTAESDLAAAKAFLGENGWFVYYEEGNQIMPRGITSFQDADFKTKMSKAAGAYTNLSDGAKAILDTLYVSDGQHLCKFSERVDGLKAYADSIGAGGTDPGPGGGEQGEQVDIDKALEKAGYTAPVLQSNEKKGDFYVTFPQELQRGTDYEYNYADGVLTVTVLKGSEEHWLAAAKSTNNGSVGYTLHFVKPENAARIAKFNGNNDQAAYQFINGNMEFNGVGDEQAFGGVMAAVNQSGDVLSVTATPNFNGMRSFVVWAAGAESEEAGQNTPIERLAIRAEIVIEKENYFHYETISQPINDVEASRLTSGAILETKYQSAWECTALEPGVLIVRPTDGKTVNESMNASQNVPLGKVTITAPSGYTLVLDACKVLNGNNAAISENSNTNGDSKCVVSLIALGGDVGRAQYLLVWKDAAGNIKQERFSVSVEDGAKLSGLGTENKPISVPTQGDMDTSTGSINVTYDGGHFYTSFDSSAQLPSDRELEKGITLKPDVRLQGVTHYRVMSVTGGSSALEGEILNAFNTMFKTVDPNAVKEYHPQSMGPDLQMRYVEVAYQDIGGVTVGYTSMLGYRHMAAEWLKEKDDGTYEVLGYTYVCGRNDSFVQTTITDAESSEKNAEKPYIIGKDGEKFKCDRYPQRGEGKDKQYFQFTLIDGQGRENGKYVVYIPYSYFGMTAADGAARKARGEHPTIKHYYNNHEFREEFEGEYTECGIKFEVSSFSPFVISTAAQSSSGGGYYYGGASTPGISAVKTADAAKSATDYTSGIYGLTFRSTAAFSGFKGVQVDGRTIAAANYVAEDNGGIEVYLKAVYLRTLKDGRHTVTILSDAGNVTMNFTIGGVDSPTTFDAGIGAYVSMALASVGGMAWMSRKKR